MVLAEKGLYFLKKTIDGLSTEPVNLQTQLILLVSFYPLIGSLIVSGKPTELHALNRN